MSKSNLLKINSGFRKNLIIKNSKTLTSTTEETFHTVEKHIAGSTTTEKYLNYSITMNFTRNFDADQYCITVTSNQSDLCNFPGTVYHGWFSKNLYWI